MSENVEERPSKRPKVSAPVDDVQTPQGPAHLDTSVHVSSDPRELEVGITAFVSEDTKPFTAILKQRYTDFLVNEISTDGEIVHLLSTSVPEKLRPRASGGEKQERHQTQTDAQAKPAKDTEQDPNNDESKETNGLEAEQVQQTASNPQTNVAHWISDEDKQQLIEYINAEAVSELLSLYQAIQKHPQRKPKEHPFVRTAFTDDRSQRAEIHGCIRRVFSSRIESSTDKDGFLVLTAASPGSRAPRPGNVNAKNSIRPGKLGWAERGGEYLHFTLYKENKDTMEAISYLVRQMKVNAKTFQFAGTKDRRAVTSQRVSAHRMDAGRLAGQNRSLRGSRVGDFEYATHGLELGDLSGNEFTITLRECNFDGLQSVKTADRVVKTRQILESSLNDLQQKGYLNYFGMQRFGTFATRTDTVGLHLLKGDFQAAVEGILHFDPDSISDADKACVEAGTLEVFSQRGDRSEDHHRAIALLVFQKTSSSHRAMAIMPRKFSAEASLIRHLQRQPSDYLGALMNIPRNLRLMYVHAYQSLVWNHAITQRMAKYGRAVVEGDLILISEHRNKNQDPANPNKTPTTGDIDVDGEIIITPQVHDRASNIDDAFERARHLTAEEASSGQYTIFDVVLPLPGYDILYPDHDTGTFYKSFMAANGDLDPMDMRRKQRDFSLSGSYRKILSRIGDKWTVDVKSYTKDDKQFVQTDLDELIEKEQARKQQDSATQEIAKKSEVLASASESNGDVVMESEDIAPEKVAAILKFRLGSSQYATMALRELSRGGIAGYQPRYTGPKGDQS